jgi:hypothetical protein
MCLNIVAEVVFPERRPLGYHGQLAHEGEKGVERWIRHAEAGDRRADALNGVFRNLYTPVNHYQFAHTGWIDRREIKRDRSAKGMADDISLADVEGVEQGEEVRRVNGDAVALSWLAAEATPAQVRRDDVVARVREVWAEERPALVVGGQPVDENDGAIRVRRAPGLVVERDAGESLV